MLRATVATIWLILILIGCTASPMTTATPASSASPTASTTPVAPSEAPSAAVASSGPPMLGSTTVAATEAPPGSIQVVMVGPPPVFRPKSLTVDHGDVVFFLQNDSPSGDSHAVHTLAIGHDRETPIVVSEEVPGGKRAVFTVQGLEPGAYVIWCTSPNHAGLGQTGTLTVE